ncbi:hypothetical protein GCM10007079_06080 [Nocardiopsis terrae]|uniref:Uncharacterized protein n=1 Tax=Nocardiopsis terrae TaxID=372655 RepID=A0ABR9HNQ2_9ACTN|nr:hypothetical protein [Nocardiopsis terrae]MBE1460656.1 hypothetical protein [Nocardiopsis terrae]GHC72690.1 hypothetical protein GCM10007079_06080 [Nocardiopsis terrae]
MLARFSGFFVGSVFGLAFVLINSGPPLPPVVSLALRALAVTVAVAIVVLALLAMRRDGRNTGGSANEPGEGPVAPRFGALFRTVTLVEFALILGGVAALNSFGAPSQAGVAWVAFIVGLHFFPLGLAWRQREILHLAWYATALGAIGLVMVFAGYPDWVPLVSGVVTGAGMLLGALTALVLMHREAAAPTPERPA